MERLGRFISSVFLTVFYFVVLPIFALPFRLIALFRRSQGATFYQPPSREFRGLEDFARED